jgi:hypothetical protein
MFCFNQNYKSSEIHANGDIGLLMIQILSLDDFGGNACYLIIADIHGKRTP